MYIYIAGGHRPDPFVGLWRGGGGIQRYMLMRRGFLVLSNMPLHEYIELDTQYFRECCSR